MELTKHLLHATIGKKIKLKHLGSGYTSHIFESKDGRVIGYTVDKNKLRWIEKQKYLNFKLIKTFKVEGDGYIYKYKVNKLFPLSKFNKKLLKEELLDIVKKLYRATKTQYIKEVIRPLLYFVRHKEFRNILIDIFDTFKSNPVISLDLHLGQFMETKDGKIVCIDCVFESTTFNRRSLNE